MQTWLITGGAGFIGSNLANYILSRDEICVINLDKLTYAGNLNSLSSIMDNSNHIFIHGSIGDRYIVNEVLQEYKPHAIINLAAESHVDRSIDYPADFIQTNIVETFELLELTRKYWNSLDDKENFRFLHVSTDEVYGSLGSEGFFTEDTPYAPKSPYSASKASSDHLVRAYYHTYGLPTLITNCSNNYGPYQFPEKLMPLIIIKALKGEQLPIYGDGKNVRDWLYVEDHCRALCTVLDKGVPGETYNIGGNNERTNLEVVKTNCYLLDQMVPDSPYKPHESLITFVQDRPGHDRRYAIDAAKIKQELGWVPQENFETGLRKTIMWYLTNKEWWQNILNGSYRGERLGLSNIGGLEK